MNDVVTKFGPVVGRILIALLFLWSGYGKVVGSEGSLAYMASKGVPLKEIALVVSIIVELAGAAMLILGWKARLGATALFLWMIPVTLMMHNFWAVPPEQAQLQMIMFMKNLSIIGGLLYVMAFGSGAYGIDKK